MSDSEPSKHDDAWVAKSRKNSGGRSDAESRSMLNDRQHLGAPYSGSTKAPPNHCRDGEKRMAALPFWSAMQCR